MICFYFASQYKEQSKLYLQEATWFHEKSVPSFKEHEPVSVMSSFVPAICLMALLFAQEDVATKEAAEWAVTWPEMYIDSGKIGRFLNDIASYKVLYK